MLRNPVVLKNAEQAIMDLIKTDNMGDVAKYVTIAHLLPFDPSIPNRENVFFMKVVSALDKMSIRLGVDYQNRIITSDNPVYCYAPDQILESCKRILFPVTSNMIIELCRDVERGQRNRMFELSDDNIVDVYYMMAYCANNRIFSRNVIGDNHIDSLRQARLDRTEDIIKGYYKV